MRLRSALCASTQHFQLKVLGNSFGLRSSLESAGLTKMSAKIAINGFGHSGRMLFLATLHHPDLELVAINELTETASN